MKNTGKEDKVNQELVDTEPDVWKPVQTKWASGFVHGDPWEERTVVLDEDTLPFAENKVTIGPGGVALRTFFLRRLEQTFAEAAKSQDPVLVLMFAHGDLESSGGLYIGTELDSTEGVLPPRLIAEVHAMYPDVKVTLFMTSCYSGHWVETVEFRGNNKPTVLAAAEPDQESSGFVWSTLQRHAGVLFSASTITELLQEPAELRRMLTRIHPENIRASLTQYYRRCIDFVFLWIFLTMVQRPYSQVPKTKRNFGRGLDMHHMTTNQTMIDSRKSRGLIHIQSGIVSDLKAALSIVVTRTTLRGNNAIPVSWMTNILRGQPDMGALEGASKTR